MLALARAACLYGFHIRYSEAGWAKRLCWPSRTSCVFTHFQSRRNHNTAPAILQYLNQIHLWLLCYSTCVAPEVFAQVQPWPTNLPLFPQYLLCDKTCVCWQSNRNRSKDSYSAVLPAPWQAVLVEVLLITGKMCIYYAFCFILASVIRKNHYATSLVIVKATLT